LYDDQHNLISDVDDAVPPGQVAAFLAGHHENFGNANASFEVLVYGMDTAGNYNLCVEDENGSLLASFLSVSYPLVREFGGVEYMVLPRYDYNTNTGDSVDIYATSWITLEATLAPGTMMGVFDFDQSGPKLALLMLRSRMN
jgi:hypothetical protein